MLWLDAFFRFSAIGLLMLSMPVMLTSRKLSKPMVYLLVSQFFLLVHLLGFTPLAFHLPDELKLILRLLDVGLLVSVWLFVLSMFQRHFKLQVLHVVACAFVAAIMLAERLVQYGYMSSLPTWWAYLVNISALFITIHMVFVTITGHTDDLVEARRRTRIKMMLLVALSVTIMVVLGSVLLPEFQPTINAISIWPLVFIMSYWVFRVDDAVFAFDAVVNKQSQSLSVKETKLQTDLMQLIDSEKIYLQANITINSLAKKLGVSAHVLRQHINQHLGFENFSAFINQYRIEDIKLALENPENNHIPVLTLALNYGFNSLPPFNRAFKKITGQTPSAYRKNTLT
ncbi:helix-turn-helix transcriptional regulator [Marinicella rhabdoformis]|uniref:helix-turn-helix transcriptional regulator n=1 Tax=Marinicella rhabdoformis TaxID=2580566 RepID=UPI0012AED84F|nr:helix-turn-helix transcriptional regulator [Marinicella rhabdoformis]